MSRTAPILVSLDEGTRSHTWEEVRVAFTKKGSKKRRYWEGQQDSPAGRKPWRITIVHSDHLKVHGIYQLGYFQVGRRLYPRSLWEGMLKNASA